jgi:WD40 repeat protein
MLALEATHLADTESAEQALREALLASRLRAVVPVGEPLLSVTARGHDLFAATIDGVVIVADARTGEIRRSVSTQQPARRASFARDGTALLTGRDGQVRIVRRSGEVTAIPGVVAARGAELSPDASRAAVIEGRGVRLIDAVTGDELETYVHRGAISAAISKDNRRVLTGGRDDRIHVWSGQSGRRVHTLNEHQGNAVAVTFSPDGSYVASASTDGSGRVWRSADWGLESTIAGHTVALTDIAFSTDSEQVVTASRDGTARVSKPDDGVPLFVLAGHDDWVTSVAFSGGVASAVVTASLDGKARVWDSVFQPELTELARLSAPVTSVAFATDGEIIAHTSDGRRQVLDAETGDVIGVELEVDPARNAVGSDGSTATIRGKTVILRTGERTTILEGHRDRVTSVSFSSDGTLLATASLDHDARIWDVATAKSIHALQHNTAVRDARFSPDGRWLVTAANRVGLWNVRNGTLVRRLRGHDGTSTSAAFDPTGRTIVTGGVDATIRTQTCEICSGLDELVALAEERLAATGRELTPEERQRYLG